MSPEILKYIKKGVRADFGKEVFPKIIQKENLYGYNTAEYLKDMGTPERLKEVREDYKNGKIERLNKENKRGAIFLDRDGVINKYVGLLYRTEDFELLPGVGEAIRKINRSEFLAIVITNQPVIARNLCSIEELEEIHKKMETLLGRERAKLDAIYYCPHHSSNEKCLCRKPNTLMLEKAIARFNINVSESFLIGDGERDIEAGKKVGLHTIKIDANENISKYCKLIIND